VDERKRVESKNSGKFYIILTLDLIVKEGCCKYGWSIKPCHSFIVLPFAGRGAGVGRDGLLSLLAWPAVGAGLCPVTYIDIDTLK